MQAFHGIRIIDFTHVLAGPFCTYQLAVMGADVIKIEPPHEPDMMRIEGPSKPLTAEGRGSHFICQNGNKRSLCVDLRQPEGLKIIKALIEDADVLVENYRGGVLERLGLDYESVSTINPRIIYCSLTGFGRTGPKADHPAYDNVIQAFSGLMAATGTPDTHPVRVGPAVLDYGTGAQAAFSIASALFQRTQTNRGQKIDVAMADAALMLMTTHVMDAQVRGRSEIPFGNRNPHRAGYSLYQTANGDLMVGAFTVKQNMRLWRALGRDDIAESIRQDTSAKLATRTNEQAPILDEIFQKETADHWESLLMDAGVPAARVRRIDEAIEHPQILSRRVLQESERPVDADAPLRSPVAAFSYAHDGPEVSSPAPRLGEHTEVILKELGMDETYVRELVQDGVVLVADR